MNGEARAGSRAKRPLVVLVSGVLLGLAFYVVDMAARPGARLIERDASTAPRDAAAAVESASGVYVMKPAAAVREAPPQRTQVPAPQAPAFPFSFFGKMSDGGVTTIVLYGEGRIFKVRGTGPLDDRYQVDAIYDDHLVIRYLPLGTEQVVELSSRQYDVPASLRGEYPQD